MLSKLPEIPRYAVRFINLSFVTHTDLRFKQIECKLKIPKNRPQLKTDLLLQKLWHAKSSHLREVFCRKIQLYPQHSPKTYKKLLLAHYLTGFED